jgi:lambda family phage minor tail protein L
MGHIAGEASKLDHGAEVEMFVIDLSKWGAGLFRYAAQVNELGNAIVWRGNGYAVLPIQGSGWNKRSSGAFPRPRLKVSNTRNVLGALIRQYDNLRGATVIRRRTLATFLDAVNFAAGNPNADPLAGYEDEIWQIDRTITRNKLLIEWELANPIDVVSAMLPGRRVLAQHCPWGYRDANCGYTGGAVAKGDDTPTTVLAEDKCSHRPSGCVIRFPDRVLPAGFFPGAGINREA